MPAHEVDIALIACSSSASALPAFSSFRVFGVSRGSSLPLPKGTAASKAMTETDPCSFPDNHMFDMTRAGT
jgi:hypothetical protein